MRKTFYAAKTFVNEPDKLLIELCSRNLEYFNEFYPEMLQNFQQVSTTLNFILVKKFIKNCYTDSYVDRI